MNCAASVPAGEKPKKNAREFNFKRFARRRIALLCTYLGWDYDGLVVQDSTDNTIEDRVFGAMEKTKLIESRDSCNMARCGRTDKGVSAFRQVFTVDVRSNLQGSSIPGLYIPDGYCTQIGADCTNPDANIEEKNSASDTKSASELNYPMIINRVLPPEIRILSWAPVDREYSARFNCKERTYKYWFPCGRLDVEKMKEASQFLIGDHDFQNFCRLDRDKTVVQNTERSIHNVDLKLAENSESQDSSYAMVELTITASAFLWHQIRCIVGVLLIVGERKEEPQVVRDLLDTETVSKKPAYPMAADFPLCLFSTEFQPELEWIWDQEALGFCMTNLQRLWTEYAVKTTMLRRMLHELGGMQTEECRRQTEILYPGPQPKTHIPLLKRPRADNAEDIFLKGSEKRKKKLQSDTKLKINSV